MSETESQDPMVAALLREREGYARDGRADRVGEVDEALKARGYSARDAAPKGRRSGKSETAADSE